MQTPETNPPQATAPELLPAKARGLAAARGRLAGRKILVLGAGQQDYGLENPPVGNGRAMSRLFAREGAALALADIDPHSVSKTARLLADENSAAIVVLADASDPGDLERAVDEAQAGLGGLDGLALNVGVVGGWGLEHTSAEDWDRAFAVNTRAHFLTVKHALAVMPEGSSIVLISSIASLMPANDAVSYHASKAALHGLCLWLAKHCAPRQIRVNLVLPGLIDTSLGRLASQADPSRQTRTIPLGREGTAWEVAHAAVFLLCEEASYITGHSLVVDGGLLALR
jgi:NAD(P)-dependent dehydrogenase (short-subunit alcohol dehydrogenase family)